MPIQSSGARDGIQLEDALWTRLLIHIAACHILCRENTVARLEQTSQTELVTIHNSQRTPSSRQPVLHTRHAGSHRMFRWPRQALCSRIHICHPQRRPREQIFWPSLKPGLQLGEENIVNISSARHRGRYRWSCRHTGRCRGGSKRCRSKYRVLILLKPVVLVSR